MKVKSDKLWQEQVSSLRASLDEESLEIYLEIIHFVSGSAENALVLREKNEGLADGPLPASWVIEAVRDGFEEIFREKGFLIPDALSNILVVLILHWEYGEQVREGLSPIEFSLVAEAMAAHLEIKAEEASRG